MDGMSRTQRHEMDWWVVRVGSDEWGRKWGGGDDWMRWSGVGGLGGWEWMDEALGWSGSWDRWMGQWAVGHGWMAWVGWNGNGDWRIGGSGMFVKLHSSRLDSTEFLFFTLK